MLPQFSWFQDFLESFTCPDKINELIYGNSQKCITLLPFTFRTPKQAILHFGLPQRHSVFITPTIPKCLGRMPFVTFRPDDWKIQMMFDKGFEHRL